MRSPSTALLWEIWRQNRLLAWAAIALLSFASLLNAICGESWSTKDAQEQLLTLNSLLACGSIFLVFGIFNYTEFNPQKQWTGFPYHLFTLPVQTWRLVALPMIAGVSAAELLYFGWVKLVFVHGELVRPGWFGVLIGVYLVFLQTILWTLAGFRVWRIVVLSLVGTSLVGIAFLPFFSELTPRWWLAERLWILGLIAMALLAYFAAWVAVSRQRTGGGLRQNWIKNRVEGLLDFLPRRQSVFGSAAAAQFWLEWRRSGLLLPGAVAAILLFVIGPLSWGLRKEADIVLWILPQTLAMPVILALAMSKGFSKPDFWSTNLALSSFIASRPMATGELVLAKLKAAALSVAMAWSFVVAFLCLWLALWANVDQLGLIRIGFWMVYGHSLYPQYAIAVLLITACMLLTWRFLVGGLCVGLSGNRKLFVGSVLVYCLTGITAIISFSWLLNNRDEQIMAWIRWDPNALLRIFEWILAIAVIGKFWLAAFSWRKISAKRSRQYIALWSLATLTLIVLAKLLWANGCLTLSLMSLVDFLPLDPYRLECFLILLALIIVPLARLGLAPSALDRNRRGKFVAKDSA